MAWTDLLQGTQQSLANTLGRKDQRREGSLNRLQDVLARLGQQKFQAGEGEKERGYLTESREDTQAFTNEQALAEQLFRTSERVAGQEYQTGEREAVEGFTIGRDSQSHKNRLELQKVIGAQDLQMLDAQVAADVDKARQLGEMNREYFENGSYASQTNDKTYTWTNPEQFEAAMEDMANDAYINRINLQAQLAKDPDGTADDWMAQYGQIRDDVMMDYGQLYADGMWIGLPDGSTKTKILDQFNISIDGLVANQQLSEPFGEWAKERFTQYVNNAAVAPEDEAAAGDGVSSNVDWSEFLKTGRLVDLPPTSFRTDAASTLAQGAADSPDTMNTGFFMAPLIGAAQRMFGWIPGFTSSLGEAAENVHYGNTARPEWPQGVEGGAEQEFFKSLMQLYQTEASAGRPTEDIEAHLNRLTSTDVPAGDPGLTEYISNMMRILMDEGRP